MKPSVEARVSEIRNTSETDFVFPNGLSFFDAYLPYYVKQTLEVGGQAYVSRSSEGDVSGLFLYDGYEKTGTIFTRSRAAFDYFFELKSFDYVFAEMRAEHECEIYDIYTLDLEGLAIVHRFRHEISVAEERDIDAIEQLMISTNPGMNRMWVSVSLSDGDKCFIVRMGSEIAGLGWVSVVNRVGRLHSLYVEPRFRNMGMGEDILYARLLWLKAKRARWVFSEIPHNNIQSSTVAKKANMKVSGQMFQYYHEAPGQKGKR